MKTQPKSEFYLAALLVIIGIGSRLVFNELKIYNFNAVSAAAMFGGAYMLRSRWSFIVPIATMLATDAVLGFYHFPSMIINYGALVLCMVIGRGYAAKPSMLRYIGVVLGGSVSFFLITNAGAWMFQTLEPVLYPMTFAGLMQAYVNAIPFFQNSFVSNMLFSAVLFGGFEMAKVFLPKERLAIA